MNTLTPTWQVKKSKIRDYVEKQLIELQQLCCKCDQLQKMSMKINTSNCNQDLPTRQKNNTILTSTHWHKHGGDVLFQSLDLWIQVDLQS